MNQTSELLQKMADLGLTLGSVESMTGGGFAEEITSVPGASHVYKGGIVAYTREIKEKIVGIDPAVIDKYGVVSREVARQLAIKGKEALGVDVCISITGNAGPDAEKGQAKVGDFHLGLAYKNALYVLPVHFDGTREKIRERAIATMVTFVASLFKDYEKKNADDIEENSESGK